MEPIRSLLPRAKLLVAMVVLAGASAFAASAVLAQSPEELLANPTERLVTPRIPAARPGLLTRSRPTRITTGSDSVWVGHSIQIQNPLDHTTFSYGPYHVGRGLNRPKVGGSAAENSGVWTWDHFQAGESDSLQGWWPMRRAYGIVGAGALADVDRPWWAVDIGNQGNYVLPSAQGRTRGGAGSSRSSGQTGRFAFGRCQLDRPASG